MVVDTLELVSSSSSLTHNGMGLILVPLMLESDWRRWSQKVDDGVIKLSLVSITSWPLLSPVVAFPESTIWNSILNICSILVGNVQLDSRDAQHQ